MPLHFSITNKEARAALDAVAVAVDLASPTPGYVIIYAAPGEPMPLKAGDPLTDQVALVQLTMSDPAFDSAVEDVGNDRAKADANAIAKTPAAFTGVADFCRVFDGLGNVVQQGNVGITGSGAFLELATVNLEAGVDVEITSMVWGMPEVRNDP